MWRFREDMFAPPAPAALAPDPPSIGKTPTAKRADAFAAFRGDATLPAPASLWPRASSLDTSTARVIWVLAGSRTGACRTSQPRLREVWQESAETCRFMCEEAAECRSYEFGELRRGGGIVSRRALI